MAKDKGNTTADVTADELAAALRRKAVFGPLAASLRKVSADVLKAAAAHTDDDELYDDALASAVHLRELAAANAPK